MSYIVARLREKGLVVEKKGLSSKRGAKPVLLSINPSGRYCVAVEINPSYLMCGLFDFTGKMVDSARAVIAAGHRPGEVADMIEINVKGLLGRNNIENERVAGLGLTLSGSVSSEGVVELAAPLGWKGVELRRMLEERFDEVPVTVYTTRIRLLAESKLQPELLSENVLYLNIANGVGATMIVDGNLVQGATNRAGEIGHIVMDPGGPMCNCGHQGCLEALVSGPAITGRIRGDISAGVETRLSDTISDEDLPEDVINKWGDAVRGGDAYSLDLRDSISNLVAKAACIGVNCFDPNVVLLAGYVSKQIQGYLEECIRKEIGRAVFDNASRDILVTQAKADGMGLLYGAAQAVLDKSLDMA
jgi:predicted NBD/HSP70 family sugar kinase